MKRSAGNVVLAATMLVALAGCAYQDPLALPDLGPPTASGPSPYGSYSPYYSYGYNYGYGSGYRPGYDPYYNYYYGADPRYYGPGVVYVPYPRYVPVPCADANNDGRCDQRPRGDDDGQDGHGNTHGGQTDGKHDGIPRWPQPRDVDGGKGEGPRVRREGSVERYGAPGMTPRVAPAAPVIAQPAPAPRAAPPPPRQPQVRPQDTPRRAAPPPDRGPRVAPARPPADDGSPPRSPD
jgi:hypothetical protein